MCGRAVLWSASGAVTRSGRLATVSLTACAVQLTESCVAAAGVVVLAASVSVAVLPLTFYEGTLRVAEVAASGRLSAVLVVPVGAAVEGASV